MIDEVPRAGLRPRLGRRRGSGRQLAGRRVERELIDAIVTEGRHEHEAIRGVGKDRVRVGIVLEHLLRWEHLAGRADRIHRDSVTGIRGAQQKAAGPVGRDVGQAVGERAARDELQLAGRRIDREADRDLRLAARADVEDAAIGAHRHRRRDARLLDARNRHLLDDREVAVLSIELQDVNLVALGVADVDEGGGARWRGHQRPRGHRDERGHPDPEPETMCSPHGVLLGNMSTARPPRSGEMLTPAARPPCGSRRTRGRSCARTRRRLRSRRPRRTS